MKTIQFLTDVELCIHILPENADEIDFIYNSLLSPDDYISVGRREDIARIDDVSKVKLKTIDEIDDDSLDDLLDELNCSKYDIYSPFEYTGGKINGTIYKIPKVFEYINKKRSWSEIVHAIHINNKNLTESMLSNDNIFLDESDKNGTVLPVIFV